MSRKSLMLTGIALAGLFTLSACSGGASAGGDQAGAPVEIKVLGYAALFQDKYTASVIDAFTAANPDVKVTFVPAQNSAEMLGKLRTEKGNPSIDVAIMDASVANTGNHEGLFEKLNASDVPNLANVVDLGRNADGYGPAVTFDNLVLLYNPDKVSTPPTKMSDLWNAPKDSVAIPAPPDIQGIALTVLTAHELGVDYKKDISPAIDKLATLAPKVSTWEPQPDVYQTVTSGTAAYAIGWNARGQVYSAGSGGKLKVVQPADGVAFQINTINAVAGSKHAKAAKKFIDYALSTKAQESFAAAMYYTPTVKDAKVDGKAAALIAKPDDPKIVPIDWIWMADKRDGWTDLWRRNIIGG